MGTIYKIASPSGKGYVGQVLGRSVSQGVAQEVCEASWQCLAMRKARRRAEAGLATNGRDLVREAVDFYHVPV